jgi:succinyl-CoA synthetase beta subunit
MKLFEYEAKAILQKRGLTVPDGKVARNSDEASTIAREMNKPVFLKSQITVSGRAKRGVFSRRLGRKRHVKLPLTLLEQRSKIFR